MKKITMMCAAATLILSSMASCSTGNGDTPKTFEDSLGYYFGIAQGSNLNHFLTNSSEEQLKQQGLDKLDKEAFLQGLKTAMDADTAKVGTMEGLQMGLQLQQMLKRYHKAGLNINSDILYEMMKETLMADSIADTVMTNAQQKLMTLLSKADEIARKHEMEEQVKRQKEADAKFHENVKAGKEYIEAQIKADPSIKTTESGLSYKVIKEGEGTPATDGQTAQVIYTGKLIDGTEFDSSKGEIVPMPVNSVVPGFKEALKMMAPGAKYIIYIPQELGYKNMERGKITPGATLVFELEVVSVDAPKVEAKK